MKNNVTFGVGNLFNTIHYFLGGRLHVPSLCTLQSQGFERVNQGAGGPAPWVNFGYTRFMTMQNFCYSASSGAMGQFTAEFPANKTEPNCRSYI